MVATSAPGWADTSVRWLRSNHPEYVPAVSKLPFPQQLAKALYRMSWRQAEWVSRDGLSMNQYHDQIKASVAVWSEESHEDMKKFIAAGGYATALVEVSAGDEPVRVEPFEATITDGEGKVIGTERIEIEMEEIDEVVNSLAMPAEAITPERELEEIVAAAELQSDTRFGAW